MKANNNTLQNLFVKTLFISVWGVLALVGSLELISYKGVAGPQGPVRQNWSSLLQSAKAKNFTLLMFLHPKCSCSKASLKELAKLINPHRNNVDVQIWFVVHQELKENIEQNDLWLQASAIQGASLHKDPEGAKSRAIGAQSSGLVLLYDSKGKLLYQGGLTLARGHEGSSKGQQDLKEILNQKKKESSIGKVFGCPLWGQRLLLGDKQ